MTTKEFAEACNVEKRTLFYYDEIGLLKPMRVLENNYREYDVSQLPRMETIKLLQSAGLSLMEIKSLLMCEGRGRNIEVVIECQKRIQEQLMRLKNGAGYLAQRVDLRKCFLEHANDDIFFMDMEDIALSTICPEYRDHMTISFWNLGHYLSIAENTETLRPRFMFKYADDDEGDTIKPAGRYACSFYKSFASGTSVYVPPHVRGFCDRVRALGYNVGDTVYVEDLPPWMVDIKDGLIIRFSTLISDGLK